MRTQYDDFVRLDAASMSSMTQINAREIAAVVAWKCQSDAMPLLATWWLGGVILETGVLAGFVLGKHMKKR
ncbi:hypothetical protein [Paraburkholderia sp. SIMBA_054]|jgi:hypothetical protein|uniref:hypothetical protein n=1 Tax=Paraburkholderia TaxID=1822464 RepID=UPI00397A601B